MREGKCRKLPDPDLELDQSVTHRAHHWDQERTLDTAHRSNNQERCRVCLGWDGDEKMLAAAGKSENPKQVYRCHKAGNKGSIIITCIFPIRVDGSLVLNGARPDESCVKLHSVNNPWGTGTKVSSGLHSSHGQI